LSTSRRFILDQLDCGIRLRDRIEDAASSSGAVDTVRACRVHVISLHLPLIPSRESDLRHTVHRSIQPKYHTRHRIREVEITKRNQQTCIYRSRLWNCRETLSPHLSACIKLMDGLKPCSSCTLSLRSFSVSAASGHFFWRNPEVGWNTDRKAPRLEERDVKLSARS
jgi:hypothetical protein